MFKLPEKIEYVLEQLTLNSYEAYIVGGCVRDMLMGIVPSDYDITTSALPEQIQNIFEKTVPTGIKHGTITVIIDGEPIEVTTYRTDGKYDDCRRPLSVEFVKEIKHDLARRDFTVNAIAYNSKNGIVDLFCGVEDIKNKTLRAVGVPEKRFCEDALRIMRLFRFASVLNFNIEQNTLGAALKYSHLLKKVSAERINRELLKLLCGENTSVIKYLTDINALKFLGIGAVSNTEKLSLLPTDETLRLFAFLNNCECEPYRVLTNLKCSNKLKNDISLLKEISLLPMQTKTDIKRTLSIAGLPLTELFLKYLKTYNEISVDSLQIALKEITANNEPYKISHLKVDGNDLLSIGIKGNEVGETLKKLQIYTWDNPNLNTKEQLIKILDNTRN